MVARFALVAFLLGSPAAAAGGTRVEASLTVSPSTGSQDTVYVAVLQVRIHALVSADRVEPPDLSAFDVIGEMRKTEPNIATDARGVQQVLVTVEWRWRLRPKRAGKITIGEARAWVDGTEYRTKPVTVDVLAAGGTAAAPPASASEPSAGSGPPPDWGQKPFFVYAVADRTKVRVGEQLTVSWVFYARDAFSRIEPRPPRLDGFWAETLYEAIGPLKYHQENVGDREFVVAPLAKKALFPTRSGKLVIPRYETDVHSFLDPVVRLRSQELTIDVTPLPPGAPPGFDPASVGRFSIDASIDRTSVPAGESLTLDLIVRGTGAVRRMRVPVLGIDGFEVTPPRDYDEQVDRGGERIGGERKYRYLLTPRRGGTLPVGPIEFPYFDPDKGEGGAYEVARAEPMTVMVVGDPSALPRTAGATGENVIARDIRPPHEESGAAARAVQGLHRSRWFMATLAAPGALFILVVVADKLLQRMRRETPRARWRRARGRARRRLRAADVHIRGNRAGKFFGEIARALTEHIEERLGEPVAALTLEQLRERLRSRGFPDSTAESLVKELESCDFARFAPSASGPGEMRSALRRARTLLGAIEKVPPREAVP